MLIFFYFKIFKFIGKLCIDYEKKKKKETETKTK